MRTPPLAFRQPRAARLSPLAAGIALALSPAAWGVTLTVINTNESGIGSLADAISTANLNCALDPSPVIDFNLGGAGPFVIAPSFELPAFLCFTSAYNPTIDGTLGTSPGAGGVHLDGSGALFANCGLSFNNAFGYGGSLTVKGLKIENWAYGTSSAGVCGAQNLQGNLIANNSIGALLSGSPSTVGGPLATDRNVFVGNSTAGIRAQNGDATIENNFVGTPDGSSANGNGVGIFLNFAGGISTVVDNVVSGNSSVGINVYGDYGGSTLSGNMVGTNSSGSAALPNGGGGVVVKWSNGVTLSDNYVSGNSLTGISVEDSSLDIIANHVGSGTGGGALPNARGIFITGFCSNIVKVEDNFILSNSGDGLSLAGVAGSSFERNVIADNGGTGMRIDGNSCYGGNNFTSDNTIVDNGVDGVLMVGTTLGNHIVGSSIFGNGRKNINLNSSTTTLPNDTGDVDGGANLQQNWPAIGSVIQTGGQTLVSFTLDSSFPSDFAIQAYSNPTLGKPAGETFVDSMTICGDCGEFSGVLVLDGLYDNISLTATDLGFNGGTSEFSLMKAATTAPAASVTPSVINFGDVLVNTQSPPRQSVIRSLGDQPYVIDEINESGFCYGGPPALLAVTPAICYGGAFICTTTCELGNAYATNEICRVTATFAPQFQGFYTTTLYICDNTSANPHTLQLQGNAVPPPPLTINPSVWDFGGVPVGTSSEAKKFTIFNRSDNFVSIQNVSTSGEFDLLDTSCVEGLSAKQACDAIAAFAPTQSGEAQGALVVEFDEFCDCDLTVNGVTQQLGKGSKVGATLKGNGLAGGELTLPEAIEVGAAIVGGGPITHTVELRNTGISPVTISEISVSAPFTLVNNCPAVLEAGANCTLVIGFTATAVGSFTGTLTVVSDASAGSAAIPVHATGQTAAAPLLVIVPTSIGFGDRVIGSQTAPQQVGITNIGGLAATLALSTSTVDFLIAGNGCGATLAPQTTCFAQVAFRPLLGFGLRIGSFVVTSNAPNSPQAVSLAGTGCRPFMTLGNYLGANSANCAP